MTNSDHLSTETLADYAEGLLRESDGSAVATHLSGCADCRAEELLLASLSDILAADSPGPMPAMYAARIDEALAKVAMTDPLSGSFHSEGSSYQGAALDLTPSAFASSAASGGPGGPSADVIDLSSRRRLVAQGLSRVSTVAASIVLLIGGTVLGLQAINSGEGSTDPDSVAADEPRGAEATVQPSIASRATAVPIDKGAKKNPDGSFTNKDGTVIRANGSAVRPNGEVIKVPKTPPKGPGSDPAQPGGGTLEPEAPPGSKSDGRVNTLGERHQGPVVPDGDSSDLTTETPAPAGDAPTKEPPAGPEPTTAPEQTPEAQPSQKAADDAPVTAAAAKTSQDDNPPYFRQSGDTYDTDNFARRVLDLLERGGFTASSTGTPAVDPEPNPSVDPASDPASDPAAPAPDVSPSSSRFFMPSGITIAMTKPDGAGTPTAPDASAPSAPAAVGPAAFKARAIRCAQDFGGRLMAADEGRWDGKPVTVIVMTDPTDGSQVVGRVVAGGCNDRKPAKDNVQYTQYVVVRAAES